MIIVCKLKTKNLDTNKNLEKSLKFTLDPNLKY
jgi:hypothetical protein